MRSSCYLGSVPAVKTKQKTIEVEIGVKLLSREGENVNVVDSRGRSLLHYAVLCCSVVMVRAILESGAVISILDKDNTPPLLYAAWREIDSFTTFETLTKAVAQVNRPAALHTSSTQLLDGVLSVFREGFIESDSVHQAPTVGSGAVIRSLLRFQPDLKATADGFTLLAQMASAHGDTDLVQLLIQRKVEDMAVAHYYGTALHAAASRSGCRSATITMSRQGRVLVQ
jgi:ankyrin repeat protein